MALVAVGALLLTLWLAVPVQPDGRFWGAYLAEVLGSAHGGARVPPALRLLFASGTCAMSLLVFRTVLVAMMRARRPPLRGVGRFLMLEDPPELRLDVEVRRGYGGAKARGCCCLVALVGVLLVAAASPLLLMRGIATLEALVLLWLAYRLARHVATLCSRARWLEVDSHGARLMLDGQWHDVTNCESDGERAVMHVGLLSVWLSLPRLTPLQRPAGVGPLVQLVRGLLVGKEGGQS